jgi:hypothetical protein
MSLWLSPLRCDDGMGRPGLEDLGNRGSPYRRGVGLTSNDKSLPRLTNCF